MKKTITFALIGLTSLGLAGMASADSFRNMSEATGDSANASGRVVAAGGQVALGAVAVPLALAGAAVESGGQAATQIAGDMWDVANAPLVVDEDIAMAQPLPELPRAPEAPQTETPEQ